MWRWGAALRHVSASHVQVHVWTDLLLYFDGRSDVCWGGPHAAALTRDVGCTDHGGEKTRAATANWNCFFNI